MPSLPLTPDEERKVLKVIGLQSVEDLFASIPPKIREQADFTFGDGLDERGLSEHELRKYFSNLANQNRHSDLHFLGGGYYDNIIPALVDQLVLRGEFLTCYTPYQPEIAQGTLKSIFEFQTYMARLTQMEVSNASLYDGATATAEAVLMAHRLHRGDKNAPVLMALSTPPDYRSVVETFLKNHASPPQWIPWNNEGSVDLEALTRLVQDNPPYAVVVGMPNYFGIIEPIESIRKALPDSVHLIVTVPDLSALSIFEPPGGYGADTVVGEAHQLGTPLLFGGPHVGFFATRKKFVRQMPGRLVGETQDHDGRLAYSLTLATREQHIRRDKATSNICTNQGLIALRTSIYLSFLGKKGFQTLGENNLSLFDYLKNQLEENGIPLLFKDAPHYREGVFKVPNLSVRFQKALDRNLIPGIPLQKKYPGADDFSDCILICVHPKHTRADLDKLVEVLSHG